MIVIDLEGTITCSKWRGNYPTGEWDVEWHNKLEMDRPNQDLLRKVDRWYQNHFIVILTAKPYEYRKIAEKWLEDHHVQYDRLVMKDNFERELKSPEFKISAISRMPFGQIQLFIDDRQDVIDAVQREYDFVCWRVEPS